MRRSIRWVAACAAIGFLQFWMWTGMAHEDGDTVGWRELVASFVFVCVVAWFILPQKRPCGFDRTDLGHDEALRRVKDQPKPEWRRYP